MKLYAHVVGSISALALFACAHSNEAVAPSNATAIAATPACVLSASDVAFPSQLWIAATQNEPSAGVRHIVLGVTRATQVRIAIPTSEGADAEIEFETSMARVHGFVPVAEVPIYPARASIFGDVVIPLANHALSIDGARPSSLRLMPHAYAPVRLRIAPQWRECTYALLKPAADFEIDPGSSDAGLQPMRVGAGYREIFASPESDSADVAIDFAEADSPTLLEERGEEWARIRWTTQNTAFVGWINRSHNVGPTFGHGAWVGTPTINAETCENARVIEHELALWASDGGPSHAIGVLKLGARLEVTESAGEFTRVHICDPELRGVPSARILVSSTELAAALAPHTH